MKKLINIFFIVILICMNTYARPVWDQDPNSRTYRATANIAVENLAGNGVPNISGTFHFKMSFDTDGDGVEDNYQLESASFSTDQQGYAFVELFITVPSDWYNGWKNVYVSDISGQINGVDISVVESNDTQSNYYFNIYPSYVVIEDNDQNGIHDPFEMQLAQKFCPILKLHSADNGVRPVPVEILDRDGDGQLTEDDLFFRVYDEAANLVGEKTRSELMQLDPSDALVFGTLSPVKRVIFNNILHVILPHFEFGAVDHTNGSSWYASWNQKMQEHSSESAYIDGTTYTHLFLDGNNVVIQYWFFYPFNHSANRHEGDWEHINVIVDSQNHSASNIVEIEYYAHYTDVRERNNPEVINNTHPVVYVAGHVPAWAPFDCSGNGGHGNFPHAGAYETAIFYVDENVDGQGIQINFNNFNNIVLIPNREYIPANSSWSNLSWMHYSSYWGHIESEPSVAHHAIPLTSFWDDLCGGVGFDEDSDIRQGAYALSNSNIAPFGPYWQTLWESIY